jgi:hypothetical protein
LDVGHLQESDWGHHRSIPNVAHIRLTPISAPPHRVRASVVLGELDRIYHRPRPHLAYVPSEDFLNSPQIVTFDDETKYIRAHTAALLRRVHAPVIRPVKSWKINSVMNYHELPLTEKINSDHYIRRMLETPYKTVSDDVRNMSYYTEPSRATIGRGHLACITFAGGRGYPRRRHLYSDENRDIRDEIKFRSYYDRSKAATEANLLPTGSKKQAS